MYDSFISVSDLKLNTTRIMKWLQDKPVVVLWKSKLLWVIVSIELYEKWRKLLHQYQQGAIDWMGTKSQ